MMTDPLLDVQGISSTNPASRRFVPAWKRLGLKLKFGIENNEPLTPDQDIGVVKQKKRSADDSGGELNRTECDHNAQKRVRLSSNRNTSHQPDSHHPAFQHSSRGVKRETNGNRKSVSFTPETKLEDGDTSRSLIADWEAKYDSQPLLLHQQTESPPRKDPETRSKKGARNSNLPKPHAALRYLTLFQDSRSSWKFNKNRESWLLKHLFSTNDIPPQYDLALSNYLQGLQSAATRSRIRLEAEKAIKKDQDQDLDYIVVGEGKDAPKQSHKSEVDMEDPDRRRAYYEDSVRRYKRRLEDHLNDAPEELDWVNRDRLAKRRRAEMVHSVTTLDSSASGSKLHRDTPSVAQVAPVNRDTTGRSRLAEMNNHRRRKNRTSVVEISSSSSSDDQSSDDGSSEGEHQEGGSHDSSTDSSSESSGEEDKPQQNGRPSRESNDTRNRIGKAISNSRPGATQKCRGSSSDESSASMSSSSGESNSSTL